MAPKSFENGVTQESGNQSSWALAMPVCCSTAVREIGKREALGFQLVARDAAGEGHRLEADAARALDVFERQADDVADLMIVHALDDGRHVDDLQSRLLDVLDALRASFPQRLSPRVRR